MKSSLENDSINWRSALASSSGVSASRWIFSIRPMAKATWSLISRTMTGTVVSPAILAARQRRSPAMISYLS
jgi:hypothetical protein